MVLPLFFVPPTFALHSFKCLCLNAVGLSFSSFIILDSRSWDIQSKEAGKWLSYFPFIHSFIHKILYSYDSETKPQLHWLGWRWLWSAAPIYDQVAFIVDLSMKQHLTQLAGITIPRRRRRNQLSQVITIPSIALNSTRRQIDNGMIRHKDNVSGRQ